MAGRGDFNIVTEAGEKKGGRPFRLSEAIEFVEFISVANCLTLDFLALLIPSVIIDWVAHESGSA